MPIRLVVFDMAGTTVEDPDGVGGCLKAALKAEGIVAETNSVNAVMGIPKPLAIGDLMEQAGETPARERVDAIHRDFQARMIDYYRHHPDVREIEGATETFRGLRARGIKVALDTGFDRTIVDTILHRLGWREGVLDATAASDEVAAGRPHPDLIYRLMELTGVDDAAAVAKIGDTPSDLQEGTAAGCGMVVGVTSGTHSRESLLNHPHTHLIPSIRGLPDLID
ncbi:phosphonatase-like hydrolase [bacterium]|nr:MAG: phosphonatase-like hydrolase [bacterium]